MRKKEGEYNCFDGHFRVTDTPWPFSVTRRQTPRSAAPPPSPCTVTARRLREGPPQADGPGAEACSACHSTHVHWYKPDTVTEMEQKETERWQKTKTKTQQSDKAVTSWLTWGSGCGVGAGAVATPPYCARSVPTEEERQGELLFGRSKRVRRKGASHPPEESGVGAEDEAAGTPTTIL